MVSVKVFEESCQQFFLLFGKEIHRVEVVEVVGVSEYLLVIAHVLVEIIEVAEHQFTPTIEVVKRLLTLGKVAIVLE